MKEVTQKRLTWAIVAMLGAALMAWRLVCAPWSDDYWYFLMFVDHSPVETWSDVFNTFYDHYLYCNCRLSHLLVYTLDLLPWWLTQVVCAALAITQWQLLVWVIGGRKGLSNLLLQSSVYLVQWFWIPWGDNMQAVDFLINYVPPTILMLLYIRWYFYRIATLSKGQLWGLALTGFVAGWWHEGFASILLVISVIPLISKSNRKRRLTVIVSLLAGFLLNMGPGTMLRIDTQEPGAGLLAAWRHCITRIIYGSWPMLAVAGTALAFRVAKGWAWTRGELARLWPWLAGATMSWLTGVAMVEFERVTWTMYVLTLVVIAAMLFRGVTLRRKWAWAAWTTAMCLLSAAFMAGLIDLQWKYTVEQRKMLAPVAAGEKLAFVAERPLEDMAPWWTAWIPHRYNNELFLTNVQHQVTSYLRPDLGETVILTIPKCLDGVPFDEWPKIPGDNNLRGIWPLLVSREWQPYDWTLTFGDPTPGWSPVRELIYRIHPVDRIEHWQYAVWRCVLPDGTDAYLYNYNTPWLNLQVKYRSVTRIDRSR